MSAEIDVTQDAIDSTIDALNTMAHADFGYRSNLCILEMVIEMDSWFSNVGNCYHNHQQLRRIQEVIIPEITYKPSDLSGQTWDVAKRIKERHTHMSIHAAESAAEYWMNR